MAVRRVVTGHTPAGEAIVVSDDEVAPIPIGDRGSATTLLWGRDDPGQFPDDGSQPVMAATFPPPGRCAVAVMTLAPGEGSEFHEFVRDARPHWADPDDPGMHRTATLDYDFVLEGTVGLELDNGTEVTLRLADLVVQNGTRHRWHNRGTTIARVLAFSAGAVHQIAGGGPPPGLRKR